jgi:hypothetical protein
MGARTGIPTLYKGVLMRSRHEAAWARTFDALSLRWDYEPTDLAGYLPDFDLLFGKRPLLVEIKPAQEAFDQAKSKIECSGWDGDIAILVSGEEKTIGIMFDGDVWDECAFAKCLECKCTNLAQVNGDWRCRSCDADGGQMWFAYDIREQWVAAKNEMQWRPAR